MIDKKYNKRDLILISILVVLLGGLFLGFRLFSFRESAAVANVYYGTSNQAIVTIDFVNQEVTINYNQVVSSEYEGTYPSHNNVEQTLTLLGDYVIDGRRQIVVLRYDYNKRSVQIIEEQSPNHICSREGESTGWPLICLPNRIRVEFSNNEEDFEI